MTTASGFTSGAPQYGGGGGGPPPGAGAAGWGVSSPAKCGGPRSLPVPGAAPPPARAHPFGAPVRLGPQPGAGGSGPNRAVPRDAPAGRGNGTTPGACASGPSSGLQHLRPQSPAPLRDPGHDLAVVLFQAAPEVARRFPICRRERCDVLFIDPDGPAVRENQEGQAEIGPLHAVVEERGVTRGVEVKTGGGPGGADPVVDIVRTGGPVVGDRLVARPQPDGVFTPEA